MPSLMMLIGFPGCGKSTWVDKMVADNPTTNFVIASSDAYIEEVAKSQGKTYNEVFKTTIKAAGKHVNDMAQWAIKSELDLIWDQTNLTRKVREGRIKQLPKEWKKLAVVVNCKDTAEWERRLASRPGKIIPPNTIKSMVLTYERPVLAEGFDAILDIWT
jgi:predicted kinase